MFKVNNEKKKNKCQIFLTCRLKTSLGQEEFQWKEVEKRFFNTTIPIVCCTHVVHWSFFSCCILTWVQRQLMPTVPNTNKPLQQPGSQQASNVKQGMLQPQSWPTLAFPCMLMPHDPSMRLRGSGFSIQLPITHCNSTPCSLTLPLWSADNMWRDNSLVSLSPLTLLEAAESLIKAYLLGSLLRMDAQPLISDIPQRTIPPDTLNLLQWIMLLAWVICITYRKHLCS